MTISNMVGGGIALNRDELCRMQNFVVATGLLLEFLQETVFWKFSHLSLLVMLNHFPASVLGSHLNG